MEFLGNAALILAGAGFFSVLTKLFRLRRAERELVHSIEKQDEIIDALERTRRSLDDERPDPEMVAMAQNLVGIASNNLSDRTKRVLQAFLVQGSDKSQANYLAKLIDVLEVEREDQSGDTRTGRSRSGSEIETERAS